MWELFIILIVILLLISYANKHETFQDNFLHIIKSNENIKARGFATLEELLQKYKSSILEPTKEQMDKIQSCMELANTYMKDIKFLDFHDIEVFLVQDYVEAGYPFTVERKIIMPVKNLNRSDMELATLLVHEKIHIFQRYNRKLCDDLFINYWDFLPVRVTVPSTARNNPDIGDTYYAWNYNGINIIPFIVLDGNTIKSYDYHYFNKRMEIKKGLPEEYISFFDGINQKEHPNEIMAEMLANVIMYKKDYKTRSHKQLIKWLHVMRDLYNF
jgi:hypothetical protein